MAKDIDHDDELQAFDTYGDEPHPFDIEFEEPRFATLEEARNYSRWFRPCYLAGAILSGCLFVVAISFATGGSRFFWLGYIALVPIVYVFGLCVWALNPVFYCPRCGVPVGNHISGRIKRWCPGCGTLLKPGELQLEGRRLEVAADEIINEEDPVLKFFKVMLSLGLCDKIDGVSFGFANSEPRVDVNIGEESYEFEVPPTGVHPQIVEAAKALWRDDGLAEESSPIEIEVRCEFGSAGVTAHFSPLQQGENFRLKFKHHVGETTVGVA